MLFKILTAPVTAPVNGLTWLGGKLADQADMQMNDPDHLKQELVALEAKLDAGELSEEEFETLELDIVMRLQASAKRSRA